MRVRLLSLLVLISVAARAEPASERDLAPIDLDEQIAPPVVGEQVAARIEDHPLWGREDGKWRAPTWQEGAVLAAAEIAIAVDVLQTLYGLQHDPQFRETNVLLGPHPSKTRLLTLGSLGGLATAAAWLALPPGWRTSWAGAVFALEAANDVQMRVRFGYKLPF